MMSSGPVRKYRGGAGRSARAGFTLVEILVATAIMAIIAGMILTITMGVLNIWNRSASKIETAREARFLLALIERDLDGIRFDAPGEFLSYTPEDVSLGGNTAFDLPGQARLHFVASVPDALDEDFEGNPTSGDISLISYRLRAREIFPGRETTRTVGVFRGLVDPQTSFDLFIGETNFAMGDSLSSIWDAEVGSPPNDGVTGSAAVYSTELRRNMIASGIVDFRTQFFLENFEDLSIVAIPPDETIQATQEGLRIGGVLYAARLSHVDVSFTILPPEGMDAYLRHVGGTDDRFATRQDIINEYGQIFAKRIALIGAK